MSLRCVYQVARAIPGLAVVGCGGVTTGMDVVEYVLAGAAAVELGTVHLAEPGAGIRIRAELIEVMEEVGVKSMEELVGGLEEW